MSIPIRDPVCGCIVASRLNRHDTKPFYLVLGLKTSHTIARCPLKNPKHTRTKYRIELRTIFGTLVGHLEWTEGHFGRYISVPNRSFVKYFPFRNVFIKDLREWSFISLR